MVILEAETYKWFGYFPSDLKPQSHKRLLAACDDCGKIREIRKDKYRALCHSCAVTGVNNPMFGKRHLGKDSSNWRGGPIGHKCKEGDKLFYVGQSRIKKGGGKYCSLSCAAIAQRRNAKPKKTRPERIFDNICKKYSLPFHFVGDGTLRLGNANPDFIHNSRKLVCEGFGDFWHSPLLNRNIRYTATVDGRRRQLKAEGYKLIVIWETDLKREDAELFVLNEISKHM
jgi:G:T-mismatch repair DNA endonuclease (very short patch repair protein)